jgi:hypothetical protein
MFIVVLLVVIEASYWMFYTCDVRYLKSNRNFHRPGKWSSVLHGN